MPIYSDNICLFIQEVEKAAKRILEQETKVVVRGHRFYNFSRTASYPLSIVIYNDRRELGYFDPNFYEIGLHECLMHVKQTQLHDIIRHELGHYLTYIHHPFASSHGPEFQALCKRFGWEQNVSRAKTTLEIDEGKETAQDSPLLRKIEKLLALTTSHNKHEAEVAMLKAQELLLRHNIDLTKLSTEKPLEETIILKRVLQSKKRSAKLNAIARILQTFFVNIIYRAGKDYTYLEISGSQTNVEIAEYVANFLERELENLWDSAQEQYPILHGLIAKNSFFSGVATGYCNKVEALKKDLPKEMSSSLIVVERSLEKMLNLVYPKLSNTKSCQKKCTASSNIGEQMGKSLQINPAISNNKTKEIFALE